MTFYVIPSPPLKKNPADVLAIYILPLRKIIAIETSKSELKPRFEGYVNNGSRHKATRFALLAKDVGPINNLDVIVTGNLVFSTCVGGYAAS